MPATCMVIGLILYDSLCMSVVLLEEAAELVYDGLAISVPFQSDYHCELV